MNAGWRALAEELARWRDAGRTASFWWRDDDAAAADAALARLVSLAARSGMPLALAVIPARAEPALFARLPPQVAVLQHGADHENRAGANDKKSEFPANEPPQSALARLAEARARLARLAGARALAVLAPPWNRIAPALVARLAGAGFRALSRYGARRAPFAAPGLREVNAHVDLVDWRGSRRFVGEARALGALVAHLAARRAGAAQADEPTGLLTHHAVHEPAAWAFVERLFDATREAGARWLDAAELFS
ncbi:MAG: hypothetical protein N2653_09030 [Burkholderiales bacterium]|nr:hypothetical protein [Burkholderiales bacterium]